MTSFVSMVLSLKVCDIVFCGIAALQLVNFLSRSWSKFVPIALY